jgi:pyrimidine-specific ribonucleoside hydrolase
MRISLKASFGFFLVCLLLLGAGVLAHEEQTGAFSPEAGVRNRSDDQGFEPRIPVVLETYPTDPALFQNDLRPFVSSIIALHGIEEWKAAVLTNELHRHLGIYSILGAKMGILAREILNASLDELTVESHAGLKPPLSCLNDGLQVATGASLGRGTITVPETHSATVGAVFVKGERKLRLRLRDRVKDRITSDVQRAIQRYGDATPEYFKEVRRLSFKYWVEMKRGEIFEREFNRP